MLRDILPSRTAEDLEIFMSTPGISDEPIPTTTTTSTSVDLLDDVFGSVPGSPVLFAEEQAHGQNAEGPSRRPLLEPSDIPRLRSTHVTNGYREGIAVSKEKHIQEGFDEGYALGAELGLKAGWCLGALEGIVRAIPVQSDDAQAGEDHEKSVVTREEARRMLSEAEEELKMQKLFGEVYFGPDGIWVYDVPGQENESGVTFKMVAEAHPLIQKWVGKVRALANTLGLVLE